LDTLRRIEPSLRTLEHDIGEMRADVRTFQQEIASLSRAIGRIEAAQTSTELNASTNRFTLWFAVMWVGALALLFAALHVWPPHP
jgi:hypothetical protein